MAQDGTQEFAFDFDTGSFFFDSAQELNNFQNVINQLNSRFGAENTQSGLNTLFSEGTATDAAGFYQYLIDEEFGDFGPPQGEFNEQEFILFNFIPIDDPPETPLDPPGGSSRDELTRNEPIEIDPFDESDPSFDENYSDAELRRQERIRLGIPPDEAEGLESTTSAESSDALFEEMQALLESEATDESGSGGGDGDGSGGGNPIDEVGKNATNFEELLEELEVGFGESRFSDRGVLGEENIERDMRYPIDIFENSGKLPNLISFEFFHKQSPKLNAANVVGNVKSAIQGIGNAAVEIGQDLGLLSEGSLPFSAGADGGGGDSFTGNMSKEQIRIIKQNQYAQGPYTTRQGLVTEMFGGKYGDAFDPVGGLSYSDLTADEQAAVDAAVAQGQLRQVTDVRINKATERSKDRIFMYVPNSLSFSDTIDYDDGSQSALRTFYEVSAGNTQTLKSALKLGVADAVSSKIGDATQSLLGEAGRFDPYGSLKAQLGLATNPFNELAFKGMARKSFQFNFTFAPTSPKEAKMMRNIIQSFRFHSLPELSESTLQYFAPHEVEVKFYRTTLTDNVDATDKFGRSVVSSEASDILGEAEVREGGFLGIGGKKTKVQQRLQENTEIPRIGRCFVNSVSLNYSPQAKSSFFVNGTPTEVQMSISLSQAITMNRQFVLKGF